MSSDSRLESVSQQQMGASSAPWWEQRTKVDPWTGGPFATLTWAEKAGGHRSQRCLRCGEMLGAGRRVSPGNESIGSSSFRPCPRFEISRIKVGAHNVTFHWDKEHVIRLLSHMLALAFATTASQPTQKYRDPRSTDPVRDPGFSRRRQPLCQKSRYRRHLRASGRCARAHGQHHQATYYGGTFRRGGGGQLDWNQKLELTDQAKVSGSGVLTELSAGDLLPIRDLMHLMIVVSDNRLPT